MTLEAELKFRADAETVAALRSRLAADGVVFSEIVPHRDVYLGHPSRDFAETDEAFRLRCEGDVLRMTYKGPRHAGPAKIRTEIELPLADTSRMDEYIRLYESLSFRVVREVRKTRESAHVVHSGRDFDVVIDDVTGLGVFVEIETLAEEHDVDAARDALLSLAASYGLTEVEPRSYLGLLLDADARG